MVVKGELGRGLLLPRLRHRYFCCPNKQTPYRKPALGCYKTMRERANGGMFRLRCQQNQQKLRCFDAFVNTEVCFFHMQINACSFACDAYLKHKDGYQILLFYFVFCIIFLPNCSCFAWQTARQACSLVVRETPVCSVW